ncbi:HAUS5 domain containing protein [Pyrenophora teres f. teres]|uniref:HAUS5 domain containing protein n=1 Tax=Pyrenophora teres f. teres TaxID=97479 RepID=A0A6S6W3R3_9PLEO|nr:HAUS5 domain containing protein [Pyrenophora teres f. teres]
MNRSRKIEDDETQDPASYAPERRASSGLSREHGKNDLFEPNVRVPGRYPSFTDGFQPLDISDDSDDGAFDSELPTTITTRQDKKSVAFNDYKGTLKDRRDVYYPSMSEQRRPSREPQDDNNIDIHSHAWVSTSPPPSPKRSASPEPSRDHAGALPYKRAHFERQPSKSYVIPRENDATVFDLWETDAQGNSQQKEPLHLASTEETSADNALNNLYGQVRDMWKDLGNERKHSDYLSEQLLTQAKVNEDLRYKDQETQDSLEGYKGDLADAQSKQKALQDQLQAADAKVAHLTKQLRDMRGSAHKDFQDVQQALDKVKNMAASKAAYKDKYRQEYDAHMVTRENIKDLQVQLQRAQALALKPARRARAGLSPPDSSDSDDDIPPPAVSRRRQRSTQPPVGAQSDNDDYDHRRHPRPKKPEPESFSGNGTTSADYLKWKMAIADWFAYYPYEFASEAMKLSYIRQKTKDQAFGCLQHGYLEPGAEFVHSDEVWSILDSVYKSLNTSIEAQSWYESSKSTMKPAESMGEYIARFNVGTSALRWNDTLKIQFMRHRLPVWWRDMTAMKVLEADITYLGFCQTLRLLEQSNPPRTTTTGNRSGGGGGGGGNKSTPSNTNRNNGSGSGSGPRGRSDIQVKVLRHLNRCFNCLKRNHSYKAVGGYCSGKPVAPFDSYPEVQDALEKAIANNGVPVGEPARPKIKGAAAGVTSTSNSSPPSENA